ncbi:MAG TPA: carbamoyltransferase C-terminal domain-containing protein [Opitutaceae bacterium]|jgi:carbamoyltransferase
MASPSSVILGIGGFLGHDANAALVVDGVLAAAAQEERYSRKKHDGAFPERAIADCLEIARLPAEAVTDIVFAEKPLQSLLFNMSARPGNAFTRMLGRLVPTRLPGLYTRPAQAIAPSARIHFAWHHLTHVVGAFETAPFERAAFLCVDGKGEDYSASMGVIDDGGVQMIAEQSYENGLGMFYTLLTNYLGFLSFGSEYKVMGLAPYGKPAFVEKLGRLFTTDAMGGFRLKAPVRFDWQSAMAALPWVAEATGVPVRGPRDPLLAVHVDIAASLQHVFETEVIKMARYVRAQTGEEALLFCGGCAQNCVAAGKLRAAAIFPRTFNSPVGGDMGSGLGAALILNRERRRDGPPLPARVDPRGFYLGSEPGPAPAAAGPWRVPVEGDLIDFVAGQLAQGKIVAWVRDRMELGARALGARSILADARRPGMQSRLNLAVKFRESFRPFAPLILAEDCPDWFDTSEPSDFMQYTANLVPSRRSLQPDEFGSLRERLDFPRCSIGSVIHVDYSARLQTVAKEHHPDMHRLLARFKALTGVPILINTSFNVSGQPIVRTAAEGWECFLNTDIDLLVLNESLYRNPFQRTREQKLAWLAQFSAAA